LGIFFDIEGVFDSISSKDAMVKHNIPGALVDLKHAGGQKLTVSHGNITIEGRLVSAGGGGSFSLLW